jgi:hypothetical protein
MIMARLEQKSHHGKAAAQCPIEHTKAQHLFYILQYWSAIEIIPQFY